MCTICLKTRCELGLGAPQTGLEDSDPLAPYAANTLSIEADTPAGTANWRALDMGVNWFDYGLTARDPVVTYTVTSSAADYGTGPYGYSEPDNYIDLSDAGEAIVREAFELWDAAVAIELEDPATNGTTRDDDIVPTLRAGGSGVPSTAWAYGPGSHAESGDIWFGVDQPFLGRLVSEPGRYLGSYASVTSIHEIGHALGLKHPHQGDNKLDKAYDGLEYTVMSYRSHVGGPTSAYTVREGSYPQSLMMLDLAMIQAHYGADHATLAGDTVYRFDTATGRMSIDGVKQAMPVANKVFRTLWDGDGTDLIDLSNYATDLQIDLRPGRGIDLDRGGFAQRALLDSSDGIYAPRHIYMSLLHEGDTRSLIENAKGGSGADIFIGNAIANVFTGGAGADTITGGLGADTFRVGTGADTIADTLAGLDGDRIVDFDPTDDRVFVVGLALSTRRVTYDPDTGFLAIDADGDGTDEARIDIGPSFDGLTLTRTSAGTSMAFATAMSAHLQIDGEAYAVRDGLVARNDYGSYALSTDGSALTVTANGWKVVERPLTIAADTVLSFDFSAATLGEIHGIGFASGDEPASESFFQLAGTETHFGLQAYNDYAVGSGPKSYQIAVGDHLAGQSYDRIVFVADDDVAGAGDSTFDNISFADAMETAMARAGLSIDGEAYAVRDGLVARNDYGSYALSTDGSALTVTANGWKVVERPVTIAADTVLSFDFSAATLGEIHGIGFASGDEPASESFFQLAGTETHFGLQAYNDYAVGSGPKSYQIAVGDHLAGQSYDRIVFVADDDAAGAGDSTFDNISIA